ncbi:MAG: rod shape-determining protein RodA [Xenococcaceae cyanobacterium]
MLQKFVPGIKWKSFLSSRQQVDWLLLLLVFGLTGFGGLMIGSTEIKEGLTYCLQHWIVGGIGLILALIIARWRYELLMQWHWVIYGLTNLFLIAVMVVGVSGGGAVRWLNIFGFNFQPSEFAKLGLIITLSALLHARPALTLPALFRALAITAVPWALVFVQPDLGTSLVFGAITLGMLYWGNANPGWLILMISPLVSAILFNLFFSGWLIWAAAMVIIAWFTLPWKSVAALGAIAVNFVSGELGGFLWGLLKDYQKDRLILFLEPEKDPLGGGYHLIQSRIAIGAGEMWGRGLQQGTQTQLNFIPEQHTDFIFSAIGEELGFVGSLILLVVFWLICLRLVFIACNAKENFGSLLAIGVLSMIVFQVVVNISMTVGLAPITGIPLPWMSYGRSALLTNFLAIGLVESVANYRQRKRF